MPATKIETTHLSPCMRSLSTTPQPSAHNSNLLQHVWTALFLIHRIIKESMRVNFYRMHGRWVNGEMGKGKFLLLYVEGYATESSDGEVFAVLPEILVDIDFGVFDKFLLQEGVFFVKLLEGTFGNAV